MSSRPSAALGQFLVDYCGLVVGSVGGRRELWQPRFSVGNVQEECVTSKKSALPDKRRNVKAILAFI